MYTHIYAVIVYGCAIALDKAIKIWRVSDGRLERTLEGHTGGISDIAWSNDSKILCSASDDTTVIIWSMTKGGKRLKILAHHMHYVFCCAFSVDQMSEHIASGSFDNTVAIWSTKKGTKHRLGYPRDHHRYTLHMRPYILHMCVYSYVLVSFDCC